MMDDIKNGLLFESIISLYIRKIFEFREKWPMLCQLG